MNPEIKVCGVTTREAIEAAADEGATAVGFVFSESPRRIDIAAARELALNAPSSLARVAVFRHPTRDWVAAVLAEIAIDRVQSDASDFDDIRPVLGGIDFMPVFRDGTDLASDVSAWRAAHAAPRRILIEGPKSGTGVVPDWRRISGIADAHAVLAGGLTPENVAEAIRMVRPAGVDTSSGVESSPGVKDPSRVRRFVRTARLAFAEQNDPSGGLR